MKKILCLVFTLIIAATALVGCGKEETASVSTDGSTSMEKVIGALGEAFEQKNDGVSFTYNPTGSGTGITAVSEDRCDIGLSSRHLKDEEKAKGLKETVLALDGIAVIVNKENSVNDLDVETIAKIYKGEITNWKEVGGQDLEITVINRASGSGTRAVFEKAVLNGTKVPDSFKPQEQDSSGTAAKMVKDTPGAISYLAFSYYDSSIKALSVDGVKPETSTVETNDWKIWAYEHMYTAKEADEATQAFIDFMMSDEVQGSLVSENGYISVSGMKVSRDADGNVTKL